MEKFYFGSWALSHPFPLASTGNTTWNAVIVGVLVGLRRAHPTCPLLALDFYPGVKVG